MASGADAQRSDQGNIGSGPYLYVLCVITEITGGRSYGNLQCNHGIYELDVDIPDPCPADRRRSCNHRGMRFVQIKHFGYMLKATFGDAAHSKSEEGISSWSAMVATLANTNRNRQTSSVSGSAIALGGPGAVSGLVGRIGFCDA